MPSVPYQPYPETTPTKQGAPDLNIATPEAAFGGASAAATAQAGSELSSTGTELFNRAIAMQQLDNESVARDKDVEYMIGAGKLHAEFNALEGEAAVRAFPKYAQDLKDLRQNIRSSIGNAQAQKMFDANSLSTMGRSIFNGAGHSASENKKWFIGSTTSQMTLDAQSTEDSPTDDSLFADKLARTQRNAQSVAAAKGISPDDPQAKLIEAQAVSSLWAARISGMTKTNPIAAREMLDANKTRMLDKDWQATDQKVRTTARSVAAANIANEVYSPDKSYEDMAEEVKTKAAKVDPDDPILSQHALSALQTKYRFDRSAKKFEENNNLQIVADAIGTGKFHTMQEMLAVPELANAINALPAPKRNAIPGQINRYLNDATKAGREQSYTMLRGLANNDLESFLDTDFTDSKYQLNQQQIRSLNDQKARLLKNAAGDPRVTKAVGLIRGSYAAQLEALGIFRRTESNKEDYDHYTGAIQAALEDYLETNKKPADDKTILQDIAPKILQQRNEPWMFGLFNSKKAFFTQTVPEDFATAARASAASRNEAEPTEQQIYQSFLRYQWQQLNSSSKKKPE